MKSLNDTESFYLSKHGWGKHGFGPESTDKFRMVLIRTFRWAMHRQIVQAIEIEMSKPDILLNSKSEWGYPKIPRLRVEVGDKMTPQTQQGD